MPRFDLGRALDGGDVARPDTITATEDEQVLAVDVVDDWGAVFRFSVGTDGAWFAECIVASRRDDGSWEDHGRGGSHGTAWPLPWRPPAEGWDGSPLLVMGTTSFGVEATFGFAAPAVRTVTAEHQGRRRTVDIASPVGAFVVIGSIADQDDARVVE